MALIVKSFAQLVQDQAAAVQTKASKLVTFVAGSILRAIAEANASVALWLQGLILYVLTLTRLTTSQGPDADTWVGDWGVQRLRATTAGGQVLFSRFTPTNDALVPVGAQVQTADGTQTFAVMADTSNSAWSSSQNGYLLPAGTTSVLVPVQAAGGGAAGNVVAGAVTVMFTAIVGIDFCSNPAPIAGGSDAESDDALKARFQLFILSLREGVIPAILYAITSLKLGLQATVIENTTPDGVAKAGFLWITVDDGTGAPSADITDAASTAVANVRAGGILWGVFPPTVIQPSIAISIATADGYDHNTLVGQVAAAVTNFVNTLPLGTSLAYSKLIVVIMGASPGITTASAFINGANLDVLAAPNNVVKLSSLTVV